MSQKEHKDAASNPKLIKFEVSDNEHDPDSSDDAFKEFVQRNMEDLNVLGKSNRKKNGRWKSNVPSNDLNENQDLSIKVPKWKTAIKEVFSSQSDKESMSQKEQLWNEYSGRQVIQAKYSPTFIWRAKTEMNKEEKDVLELFAKSRLFTFECPYSYNDLSGAGVNIFKTEEIAFSPWRNIHSDIKAVLVKSDQNPENYPSLHKSMTSKKQVELVNNKCWRSKRPSQKDRKIQVSEGKEFREIFVRGSFPKNMFRSGNVFSAQSIDNENRFLKYADTPPEMIQDSVEKRIKNMKLYSETSVPPPVFLPVSCDEELWDDDFYF